jgi:hypothetical protein
VSPLEPVRRPDTMKSPAEALEHLLSQAIPVPRCVVRVVGGTIGFDRKHEAPGFGRMASSEIDTK